MREKNLGMWPSGVIVPYEISCSGLRIAVKMWAGRFLKIDSSDCLLKTQDFAKCTT